MGQLCDGYSLFSYVMGQLCDGYSLFSYVMGQLCDGYSLFSYVMGTMRSRSTGMHRKQSVLSDMWTNV